MRIRPTKKPLAQPAPRRPRPQILENLEEGRCTRKRKQQQGTRDVDRKPRATPVKRVAQMDKTPVSSHPPPTELQGRDPASVTSPTNKYTVGESQGKIQAQHVRLLLI